MADVAIVGAGPAGLASAISLAMRKIAVTVFEPRALPIDKPCGEGIMPAGVAELKKLGVLNYLDRNASSFFRGVCFVSAQGYRAYSNFTDTRGLGCRRLALSAALYKRCLELPLIEFRQEKINHIEFARHKINLFDEKRSAHCSRIVIGADGLRSRVRTWAGLRGKEPTIQRYGLRKHFALKPWAEHVEVYFNNGIEAYITPCGNAQTNVTFLWSKDLLPQTMRQISFASLLDHFPQIAKLIHNAEPLSEQLAIGPLHQRCNKPIADGIALVGDASGYYDAITGEGISIALRQADALAKTLQKIFATKKRGIVNQISLMPYAKKHSKIIRSYYRNTSLLLRLARRPRLMNKIIYFGEKKPKIFSWLIEKSRKK